MLSWYLNAQEQAIAERAEARRRALVEQQRVDRERQAQRARRAPGGTQRAAATHARRPAGPHSDAPQRACGRNAGAAGGRPVTPAPVASSGGWRNAPIVTWYGPGFYGNRTACGVRYTRTIVGVAHRTLPCGTLVRFRWHGMTAVAPVIDRGPYASAGLRVRLLGRPLLRRVQAQGHQQRLLHAPRRASTRWSAGSTSSGTSPLTATERVANHQHWWWSTDDVDTIARGASGRSTAPDPTGSHQPRVDGPVDG